MLKVGLEDIREGACRWPLGDPTSEDFVYCGVQTAKGRSYCAGHCRMAYKPPNSRVGDVERYVAIESWLPGRSHGGVRDLSEMDVNARAEDLASLRKIVHIPDAQDEAQSLFERARDWG